MQITLTVLKYKVSDTVLAKGSTYFLASVIISAVFLAALLITGAVFLWRIIEANRSGRKWSPRRAYISGSAFLVLICQILNLALMLAAVSDVMGSSESCGWWTRTAAVLGYVQWTCWNITFLVLVVLAHNGSLWRGRTADANDALDAEQGKATHRRTTALVMDAPFLVHLPKLVFWVAFQVVTSLILWSLWPGLAHELCVDGAAPKCAPRQRTIILLSFVLVIIGCYIAAYLYYAHRTNRDIRSRPYCEMRYARIVYGLQHEQVLPVFVALGICILLLIAVQIRSCWTYIETWLGVVPLQAVGTCMAMSLCLFFMPQRPDGSDQILQAWLQQFAWTYSSLPAAIQARNARLASSAKLASEPMFCLETAIKLLYFSNLAYTCPGGAEEEDEEADGSPKVKNATVDSKDVESQDPVVGIDAAVANEDVDAEVEKKIMDQEGEEAAKQKPTPGYGNMEDALSLYDLTDHEVLYEKETDTKALLAWGKDILMVAFKGTSSFENVLTDLNVSERQTLRER